MRPERCDRLSTVSGKNPPSDEHDAVIAQLLGLLADLSQEGPALAALRAEAEAFDPAAAVASVRKDLLALKTGERPP